MKSGIIEELTGKSVLILGFGREGKSTLKFLLSNNVNCKIGIADKNDILDEMVINNRDISVHMGENYLESMRDYDVVIKTPGISFKSVNLSGISKKITSQTELFLKYAGHKTIGITGTKGKSTTSSLIYNMLKEEKNVKLVGNIGLPAFEMIDSFDDTDWYIYELSSHQLEFVDYSPTIAVLLNMFEEHLDHYKSYDAYKEAKRNIFKYQKENDWYIYNHEMANVLNYNSTLIQNTIKVTSNNISEQNIAVYDKEKININLEGNNDTIILPCDMKLKGIHNIYNIAVAVSVAKIIGVSDGSIITGIKTFETLPHRLQHIGIYNGVSYVDDSISTIPAATISAVASVDNVDTLIIGGMDRGIDYTPLIDYIIKGTVPNVILMYDSGKHIYEVVKHRTNINVIYVDNLEQAVNIAVKVTKKGASCVMSPAAASYGTFKNFEERGDRFKEWVIKYSSRD